MSCTLPSLTLRVQDSHSLRSDGELVTGLNPVEVNPPASHSFRRRGRRPQQGFRGPTGPEELCGQLPRPPKDLLPEGVRVNGRSLSGPEEAQAQAPGEQLFSPVESLSPVGHRGHEAPGQRPAVAAVVEAADAPVEAGEVGVADSAREVCHSGVREILRQLGEESDRADRADRAPAPAAAAAAVSRATGGDLVHLQEVSVHLDEGLEHSVEGVELLRVATLDPLGGPQRGQLRGEEADEAAGDADESAEPVGPREPAVALVLAAPWRRQVVEGSDGSYLVDLALVGGYSRWKQACSLGECPKVEHLWLIPNRPESVLNVSPRPVPLEGTVEYLEGFRFFPSSSFTLSWQDFPNLSPDRSHSVKRSSKRISSVSEENVTLLLDPIVAGWHYQRLLADRPSGRGEEGENQFILGRSENECTACPFFRRRLRSELYVLRSM